jgi:hypothetical protein
MVHRRGPRGLAGLVARRRSLTTAGVALAVMSTTAFWTAGSGAVGSDVQILPGLPKGGKSVQVQQFAGGGNAANNTGGIPTVQDGIALARIVVPTSAANKVRINITWTNPQQVRSLFRSRNAWITVGVYHLVHKDECLTNSTRWYRWPGNQASVIQTVYEGPELVTNPGTWREARSVPAYCGLLDVGSSGSPSVGGSWHDPGEGALLLTNKAPSGYLIPSLTFSTQRACPTRPDSSALSRNWQTWHYWGTLAKPSLDDDAYAVDSFDDPATDPVTGLSRPGACVADSLLGIPAANATTQLPPSPVTVVSQTTQSAVLYLIATVATSGGWSWTADDAAQIGSMQFYIRGKLMR